MPVLIFSNENSNTYLQPPLQNLLGFSCSTGKGKVLCRCPNTIGGGGHVWALYQMLCFPTINIGLTARAFLQDHRRKVNQIVYNVLSRKFTNFSLNLKCQATNLSSH